MCGASTHCVDLNILPTCNVSRSHPRPVWTSWKLFSGATCFCGKVRAAQIFPSFSVICFPASIFEEVFLCLWNSVVQLQHISVLGILNKSFLEHMSFLSIKFQRFFFISGKVSCFTSLNTLPLLGFVIQGHPQTLISHLLQQASTSVSFPQL